MRTLSKPNWISEGLSRTRAPARNRKVFRRQPSTKLTKANLSTGLPSCICVYSHFAWFSSSPSPVAFPWLRCGWSTRSSWTILRSGSKGQADRHATSCGNAAIYLRTDLRHRPAYRSHRARGLLFRSIASAAASFRSMCGSRRGPPACSTQRCPTATPHVGQETDNTCFLVKSLIFIGMGYSVGPGRRVNTESAVFF
jgi:hypothetical protein